MELTHEAYDAMGGLEGAVAERAERSIVEFLPDGEAELRRLFLQLVRPGEGTLDTRRRATVGELDDAAQRMVGVLTEARLVVAGHDVVTGEQTLEIAHEALIQSWQRLREWVDADREFLVWRQRVNASLEGWQHADQDPGGLLRGGPLVEAERWVQSRSDDLTGEERTFIRASLEERRSEEQAALRARRRLILQLLGGLVFFAVVAAIASGIALEQAQAADRERDDAIETFGEAETSRAEAEAATQQAAEARKQADQASAQVVEAERALAEAERSRDEAINAAINAPELIAAAEAEVAQAEADLEVAEEAMATAESAAEQAQADAVIADVERQAAEQARVTAEQQRNDARDEAKEARKDQDIAEQAAQTAEGDLQQFREAIDDLCSLLPDLETAAALAGLEQTVNQLGVAAQC